MLLPFGIMWNRWALGELLLNKSFKGSHLLNKECMIGYVYNSTELMTLATTTIKNTLLISLNAHDC